MEGVPLLSLHLQRDEALAIYPSLPLPLPTLDREVRIHNGLRLGRALLKDQRLELAVYSSLAPSNPTPYENGVQRQQLQVQNRFGREQNAIQHKLLHQCLLREQCLQILHLKRLRSIAVDQVLLRRVIPVVDARELVLLRQRVDALEVVLDHLSTHNYA